MGRRKTTSLIPVEGAVLQRSQALARTSPLPSSAHPSKSKTCFLDALLLTTEKDYSNGFKTIWQCDDSQASVHVEFAMKEGISTLAVRKGLRPRRDEPVTEAPHSILNLTIPDQGHQLAVRFYQSSFCIEIWRKHDQATNGKVWALILTSSLKDDRINAVKGVWTMMRRVWKNMSLQELSYINIERTVSAANRSLPTPPYNFRPKTMAQRQTRTNLPKLTLIVPRREDWVFTGALAKPSVARKITQFLAGTSDRIVEYESEEEEIEDDDMMYAKETTSSR
ncbi:MAG: hypothetical protein Q9195_009224, partial [Heterodermia aff. obscurata]